ncbi:hypothetical protein INT47_002829 [Mucor saturninus]|uniref:Zn(2)-C6 fungal-type domain-containing protein n=1 Tax=Mucor saturninus TaxID=64648 RepID=A0A8H7QLS1_9FUNG|nr:hypothetical protein INT47_002829 [Mucor saturninus]
MIEIYNPAKVNTVNHTRAHTITKKKPVKANHVPTACLNCKKAHLGCDLSRPCKRCSALGKCDTCIDIKHKKRGRPKLAVSSKKTNKNLEAPKTPQNNLIPLIPMTAPGLPACSFNLTQSAYLNKTQHTEERLAPSEMMTIFLSMDLCCARISDESVEFLNMKPNDVGHCSFYDLIHSDSSETLSRIHRMLLDNSHSTRVPQQQPISFTTSASSDLFLTSSPAQLYQIANGSQTLRETLKFKSPGRNLSCKFYLGGGFGADLFVPSTLDNLYMVCNITELKPDSLNVVDDSTMNMFFQQEQLDSIWNTTNLMSMYDNSLPTDNEAFELVNHLCESFMTPSTPPEGTTVTGYYSGSDTSIDSILLDCIPVPQPCKPLEFDALLDTTALLDDSMFLFTPGATLLSRWENGSPPSAV